MKFKQMLTKLDRVCSSYLGLKKEEACPTSVEIINRKLLISATFCHKRYLIRQSWHSFDRSSLKHVTIENRQKLGMAIGQAIAKNLVISFEEPRIYK